VCNIQWIFQVVGWVIEWTGLIWLTKRTGGGQAVVNEGVNLRVSTNAANILNENLLASLKKESAP